MKEKEGTGFYLSRSLAHSLAAFFIEVLLLFLFFVFTLLFF